MHAEADVDVDGGRRSDVGHADHVLELGAREGLAAAYDGHLLGDRKLLARAHQDQGRLEATDTTFWFGFKDDVVIRIQSTGGNTLVDVRSKSRVGESDLGANANRIEKYLNHLAAS